MTLNILVLCNKPEPGVDANTIIDHLDSIKNYSQFIIWTYSNRGDLSEKLDLNRFDVIVIHYSLSLITNHYLSYKAKKQIREFQGLKVIFIQDEYRQINNMIDQLQFLQIDVLFTCFPTGEMEKIYTRSALPKVSTYTNLTGYVPERLIRKDESSLPLTRQRTCHVGYRGRKLPYWYGELAYEKWNIVEQWKRFVIQKDIRVDISYHERDRIYGGKWQDFILSCKATLGVESGASVMDFSGTLEKTIELHQLKHPGDSFHKVQDLFLKDHEGKYKLNQISPRCFEAVALKTVLILYEGDYSGILIPGRHYIMLKKDFSNKDEVIKKLLDDDYLQNMADRAYHEIALNPEYSYKYFIRRVDEILANEFEVSAIKKTQNPYSEPEFLKAIKHMPLKKKLYNLGLSLYYKLPMTSRLLVKALVSRHRSPTLEKKKGK